MKSAYAWFGRHHVIMAVPLRVYYLRAKAGYLRRPSKQQGAFVGGENVQLHKRALASVGLASGVPGAVCGPMRVGRPDFASGEGAWLRRDVAYLVRYGRLRTARSTRQRRGGSEVIVRVKK